MELTMHPGYHASVAPDRPAVIDDHTGTVVTYRQLEDASLRVAGLLHRLGLRAGDHIAIVMDNTPRYYDVTWAAQRMGLYYTPINWHLTADEASYIVDDCGARVLFASAAVGPLADELGRVCAGLEHRFSVNGRIDGFDDLDEALAGILAAPVDGETEGMVMFYSSGTTGRPKGIVRELSGAPYGTGGMLDMLLVGMYNVTPESVYLCPAPLYHAAPLGWTVSVLRVGGTVVLMRQFDALRCLELIERHKVTIAQFVPTMFVRMLKLTDEERAQYDVSTLRTAVHAAAPCPVDVKQKMIEWWGPVVYEYYAGSEGNGFCAIDSNTWLRKPGSVGQALTSTVHIVDEDGNEMPPGEVGTVYFEPPAGTQGFEYHNDPAKTASAYNQRGWSTLGDVGHLDEEGFLFLSDRRSHLILSGGVNIYPQEIENLLALHPKVFDVAVIGVPHAEMGEEVKAIVQPVDMAEAGPALEAELIVFCRERLAHFKCPKSVDFDPELPRLPSGKLFKRRLIDKYRP